MAYEQKEWENRQAQYPSRRKLVETGIADTYDIERVEGKVTVPGNAFDADNMNDLENRIKSAFDGLKDSEINVVDQAGDFTSEKLDGVLHELFTFASSGKSAIADAIGETRNGAASSSESFSQLASRIENDKASYYWADIDYEDENINFSKTINYEIDFGFTPAIVFVENLTFSITTSALSLVYVRHAIFASNVATEIEAADESAGSNVTVGIDNVSKNGFSITFNLDPGVSIVHVYGSGKLRVWALG